MTDAYEKLVYARVTSENLSAKFKGLDGRPSEERYKMEM